MEKPVWDANLPAELRDGIVQCIRAANRWEFSAELPNGMRVRLVNVGNAEQLGRFLAAVVGSQPSDVDVTARE